MNSATLVGVVTDAPQFETDQRGPRGRMSIKVARVDSNGAEKVDGFFSVSAFREFMCRQMQACHVGALVCVTGPIRSYRKQDGSYGVGITADRIDVLGAGTGMPPQQQQAYSQTPFGPPQQQQAPQQFPQQQGQGFAPQAQQPQQPQHVPF